MEKEKGPKAAAGRRTGTLPMRDWAEVVGGGVGAVKCGCKRRSGRVSPWTDRQIVGWR